MKEATINCKKCHKEQTFYGLDEDSISNEECPFCGYYNEVDTTKKNEGKKFINDIHSYTVFANIDKGNNIIEGHQIILDEKTSHSIEDIILMYLKKDKKNLEVKEEPFYRMGE